jgi:hypothetical protein
MASFPARIGRVERARDLSGGEQAAARRWSGESNGCRRWVPRQDQFQDERVARRLSGFFSALEKPTVE